MAPKVWTTFTAKKSNGSDVKLRIQDMPPERLEEVLNFFDDYYNQNNAFYKLLGVSKNPKAVQESIEGMRQMFKAAPTKIVICCMDNGDAKPEIVGATAAGVTTSKDNIDDFMNFNIKTKEVTELYALFFELMKLYDVFKGKNVDRYSDERGLAVSKDYGVAVLKELLNVRRKLCKELNVPLSAFWAMSTDQQNAAEADGWETAFEVTRDEVAKKLGVTITEDPATYRLVVGTAL
ncbi:uncharacterized protein LOC106142092 [Amyelois transitella]|uniref:uncharacterized protein LOC106142092 n=1 Tax=Amyelois transitella TaxID=680683 RepID=UPI00067B55EB|nr:uncharacterized protein LOC106142092 [Amyelois transitella]